MTAGDRMLCCLDFYNEPPWMLLLALRAGTSMVAMRRFKRSRYWQVVRGEDDTVLFGIASTASLPLKAPAADDDKTHKVRLSIQVGIPALLHQDLADRWGVPWVEADGLTETGWSSRSRSRSGSDDRPGFIGVPCPGADSDAEPGRHRGREEQPGEIAVGRPA